MHTHETQSRRESCVFSFNHLILIIIIIIMIMMKNFINKFLNTLKFTISDLLFKKNIIHSFISNIQLNNCLRDVVLKMLKVTRLSQNALRVMAE